MTGVQQVEIGEQRLTSGRDFCHEPLKKDVRVVFQKTDWQIKNSKFVLFFRVKYGFDIRLGQRPFLF